MADLIEADVVTWLKSGDDDQIIKGLNYLDDNRPHGFSTMILDHVLDLCSHSSPHIRNKAIHAMGEYWQDSKILPTLISVASNPNEDDIVMNTAIYALGDVARGNNDVKQSALRALASVVMNEEMPDDTQKEAYAIFLWSYGKLSPDEFSRMGIASEVVIDKEYIASLCNEMK